jgi:hypothetical protein
MPLSEHEQRLLDQIERALYAEDPKFASNVRGARMRSLSHRRRIQGIALFLLGLLLLVAGVVLPFRPIGIPVISVLGFLVMFAGAVVVMLVMAGARDRRAHRHPGKVEALWPSGWSSGSVAASRSISPEGALLRAFAQYRAR